MTQIKDTQKLEYCYLSESELQKILDTVLTWNDRGTSRASVLLATNAAILFVFSRRQINTDNEVVAVLDILSLLFLAISFLTIILSYSPEVKAKAKSLIYFDNIASFTFEQYSSRLQSCDKDDYLNDLAIQIHINSIICQKKFVYISIAGLAQLAALLIWLVVSVTDNEILF